MSSPGNAPQSTADSAAHDDARVDADVDADQDAEMDADDAERTMAPEDETGRAPAEDEEGSDLDEDTAPDDGVTALERFVLDHVEPRAEELNAVAQTPGHAAILRHELGRRNIEIREIGPDNHVFLFGGVVVGGMDRTVTSLVSSNARRIARSKALTKRHLEVQEIPTPAGRTFGEGEITEAAKYLASLPGTGVLKPSSGRAGHGITTRLSGAEDLQRAWPEALEARLTSEAPSRKLLVEEFHDGLDLRAYVVGGTLVSAIVRVPLYVIGDGSSEVRRLLETTFARRSRHRHLAAHVPEVREDDLAPMGLSLSSVLDEGRVVVLNEAANIRAGGMPVDVTDLLDEELADLIVDALWSVPGLTAAAIDLIVPDLHTSDGAVVLEVDPSANLVPHHCPAYGTPRNVAGAIADQLLLTATR